MTLIAFATYGDHAEFITDTTHYTPTLTMGRCTKAITMPHLDAAVIAQGDSAFGEFAKCGAHQVSAQVTTFDELVETAGEWLTRLWQQRLDESPIAPTESVLFLLGWSDEAGEFAAYALAAEQDFKAVRIKGTWVMPCPWKNRPSGLELRRVKMWMKDHPDIEEAARLWVLQPPRPRPNSVEDWVQVAVDARQRSVVRFANVMVAGDVFHTRVGRGSVATERIHTFDDSGEEFSQIVAGTYHPQAQLAECFCGSGQTLRDCHLRPEWGDPCICGSGETFRDCCMVQDGLTGA